METDRIILRPMKKSILSIILAPNGTILARGLRGNEIEKKLAEIFGE